MLPVLLAALPIPKLEQKAKAEEREKLELAEEMGEDPIEEDEEAWKTAMPPQLCLYSA